MKKIGLSLLLFCGVLVSCESKTNVVFDIDKDITIELDEYTSSYDFSDKIEVFRNKEKVDYNDLKIQLAEGSSIGLGEQSFVVIYSYNDKEFQTEFQVNFVDNISSVLVHSFNDSKTYKIENGKKVEDLKISTDQAGYTFVGFYEDKNYTQSFDVQKPITSDIEIYAKYSYSLNYTPAVIDENEIVTNLNSYIDSLMASTSDYRPAWNQEGFKGRWNYIDGVFLNSIVNLYYETNKQQYKQFFLNYIDYYLDSNGEFLNPKTGEKTGYRSGELDSVCESKILFDAYEMTQNEKYLKAISKTYTELMDIPRATGTENFSHKVTYLNQIWLDGMYMYVPFLARYAKAKNDTEAFHLIKTQYAYIRDHMFDAEKKLYYHGHDTTKTIFWADKTTGNSQNFWLRSNGWFIVSLVDVLEYYPEGEDKEYLKNILIEAVKGILNYKDEKTNMFYQLIDKGPTAYLVSKEYLSKLKNTAYGNTDAVINNYLETSGSSMIAYTLLKGARLGYFEKKYEEVGKDIFEGIYGYSYKDQNLDHICISAGLGPESNQYRDGSISYYLAEPVGKNDAKGVGPFLMAYLEYAKQNKN